MKAMEALIEWTTSQDQKVASESLFSLSKCINSISKGESEVARIKINEGDEFVEVPKSH